MEPGLNDEGIYCLIDEVAMSYLPDPERVTKEDVCHALEKRNPGLTFYVDEQGSITFRIPEGWNKDTFGGVTICSKQQ